MEQVRKAFPDAIFERATVEDVMMMQGQLIQTQKNENKVSCTENIKIFSLKEQRRPGRVGAALLLYCKGFSPQLLHGAGRRFLPLSFHFSMPAL